MGARPQLSLRFFGKKVRPVVQVRVRETVVAVEVERSGVRAVVEVTAEGEQGRKHGRPRKVKSRKPFS